MNFHSWPLNIKEKQGLNDNLKRFC